MDPQTHDPGFVAANVDGVRAALDRPQLRDLVQAAADQLPGDGEPVAKVRAALSPAVTARAATAEPYFSRSPAVSLVQSALDAHAVPQPRHWWVRAYYAVLRLFHLSPGTLDPDDPNWYTMIAYGVLQRLADGTHAFNPQPAEFALADDARLVVVGDWGTGLPRAQAVADQMRTAIAAAADAGRQVHVIHLGDVYYSGLPDEYTGRFLKYWPVAPGDIARDIHSWSLNGNHDMYSGGHGYFTTLLGDPRFADQRSSGGKATSFFRLRSAAWEFLGLDTAWTDNIASEGNVGVLNDPQAGFVAAVAGASARKVTLFSHHQLSSVYNTGDIGPELGAKLAPVLSTNRVTAWWWGHEHRVIVYPPGGGVTHPRCLGNGGVPVALGPPPTPAQQRQITWQDRDSVRESGQDWVRFGFAVIDLDGDRLNVSYVDDTGAQRYTEVVG